MSRETSIMLPSEDQFGFCMGVEAAHQALARVTEIARANGVPEVYGYHDIVHNADVADFHKRRGVVFVNDLAEVPEESIVVGSAHGSSPVVVHEVMKKDSLFFDAACPLVIHTHKAVDVARKNSEAVIYLLAGKPGETKKIHDEVLGTTGHMDYFLDDQQELHYQPLERYYAELTDDPAVVAERALSGQSERFRLVGQTTLLATASIAFKDKVRNEIRQRNPQASVERVEKRDVCFAVENRQEGVQVLLGRKPDNLVVVTDPHSKNGMGYVALARSIVDSQGLFTEVHAVANADDLPSNLDGRISITASASTPDHITREVVQKLGGSSEAVPHTRASFRLRGCSEREIQNRITQWKMKNGKKS